MTNANAPVTTTTPPLPELVGSGNGDTPLLRPIFSLTPWEGALMLTVAAVTGGVLLGWASQSASIPAWAYLVVCGALSASSVCALRFVRNEKTRGVSRLGYAAFAFPVFEAFTVLLFSIAGLWMKGEIAPFVLYSLAAIPIAHFLTSAFASAFGFHHADSRGNFAALPVFLLWIVGVLWITFLSVGIG